MFISVSFLNALLALGTMALQLGILVLLSVFFIERKGTITRLGNLARRYGILLGFGIAFFGTALSLYYSEVVGYPPCGLCWLQRVFLYPQVILFGYALWRRETLIAPYAILLSVVGAIIAFYQHLLQIGITDILPCPAAPTAVSCAQRFVFEYGYITLPLMSFTAFVVIALLMWIVGKKK